ncbi:hypothetical protein [Microseira wollei]|uniref:hypothetical protein n=1 Tax=Microseira wollei TaxID=467598 RepID=UPI001CFE416B|nr:hypothetical protein [Microseira wollei]
MEALPRTLSYSLNRCRGGFHQPSLPPTDNLNKPAPTAIAEHRNPVSSFYPVAKPTIFHKNRVSLPSSYILITNKKQTNDTRITRKKRILG